MRSLPNLLKQNRHIWPVGLVARTRLFLELIWLLEDMTDNNQKGFITELQCELFFTQKNILLSKPITQDSRYDYIADIDGKLYKIQCKSSIGRDNETYIVFRTHMSNIRQNTVSYYSKEDVDLFYTYYNGIDYLIPFDKAGKGSTTLRFISKTPNNPTIKWAKDYQADIILNKIKEEK